MHFRNDESVCESSWSHLAEFPLNEFIPVTIVRQLEKLIGGRDSSGGTHTLILTRGQAM